MNWKLFDDLYELAYTEFIDKELTENQFLLFLLGRLSNKNGNPSRLPTKLSDSMHQPSFSLRSELGESEYLKILRQSQNLKLEDLANYLYKDATKNSSILSSNLQYLDILEIYHSNQIQIPISTAAYNGQSKDINEVLLPNLFTECIREDTVKKINLGHKQIRFSSYKNQQLKPSTIKSTFGRQKDAEYLRNLLKQHHKIILSAPFGVGKTRFIKYCLTKWAYDNYCYILYNYDLKSTIKTITFKDENEDKICYKDIHEDDLINSSLSSSLLVIDNMYSSPDIEAELKKMSTWAMDIIVITLNPVNSDSFYHFQLPLLSDDILLKIFSDITGMSFKGGRQKTDFLFAAQQNTCMASLIAYHCRKIAENPSKAGNPPNILDYAIRQLKKTAKKQDPSYRSKYKFKSTYDKKTLDLIGHMRCIYLNLLETEYQKEESQNKPNIQLRKLMKYFSCFGWDSIPLSFISKIFCSKAHSDKKDKNGKKLCFRYNAEYLTMLSEMGLLTLTDKAVQISPLISQTVVASEKLLPSDFDFIIDNLIHFLQTYEFSLSVPYLSNILVIFAENLYNNVLEKHNPNQQNTSNRFERWQTLIYLIYAYYSQNHDKQMAQRAAKLIKYPQSLLNGHNSLDKFLFNINNNIGDKSNYENGIQQIDELISELGNINSDTAMHTPIDMTSFIINKYDEALCILFIELLDNIHTFAKINLYTNNRFILLHKLTDLMLESPDSIKQLNIPYEKKLYYFYCYSSICTLLSPKYYRPYDNCFLWRNNNYRIRMIAVIIFINNIIINQNKDIQHFHRFVIPLINELNGLIDKCNMIPYYTSQLCLDAYISVLIIQGGFLPIYIHDNKDAFLLVTNKEKIISLLNRTNLSKKLYDSATKKCKLAFEKIDNIINNQMISKSNE